MKHLDEIERLERIGDKVTQLEDELAQKDAVIEVIAKQCVGLLEEVTGIACSVESYIAEATRRVEGKKV